MPILNIDMPVTSRSIKNFVSDFNFSTFIIALVSATAALWLNNQYVDKQTYVKDREILLLKVDNLEKETEAIRYLVSNNQNELAELTILIIKIERLTSKLITDDGEIISSKEMKQLEIDIAEIKKDISYIRSLQR